MLELKIKNKTIYAEDESTKALLKNGHYGEEENGILKLSNVEALYLIDARNATCTSSKGPVSFFELAKGAWKNKKFIAKYFAYKDWRDRGLVAKEPNKEYVQPQENPVKKYPANELKLPNYKLHGIFFKSDLITIIEEDSEGKEIYEKYWFGQYGSYKAPDRGKLNKLDVYETLFLIDHKMLSLYNATREEVFGLAAKRHPNFQSLYDVYSDWREKGYVVKTGFKFGTNFRIYFPGAKPGDANSKKWMHSKHVLHVFPKSAKLLISEWARAIRVAHSVKKTFLLALPGVSSHKAARIDFVLYHRHGGEADKPTTMPPKFAMLTLGEEEYLGGDVLARSIEEATKRKLELLLAIVDRETAVTYYIVRRIMLPKSKNEYYEIDWLQP